MPNQNKETVIFDQVVYEDYQFVSVSVLSVESAKDKESIRQSYMNTINELNQELLAMKEAYEELNAEKQLLNSQLEKQPAGDQERVQQTIGQFTFLCFTRKRELYMFFRKSTIRFVQTTI